VAIAEAQGREPGAEPPPLRGGEAVVAALQVQHIIGPVDDRLVERIEAPVRLEISVGPRVGRTRAKHQAGGEQGGESLETVRHVLSFRAIAAHQKLNPGAAVGWLGRTACCAWRWGGGAAGAGSAGTSLAAPMPGAAAGAGAMRGCGRCAPLWLASVVPSRTRSAVLVLRKPSVGSAIWPALTGRTR